MKPAPPVTSTAVLMPEKLLMDSTRPPVPAGYAPHGTRRSPPDAGGPEGPVKMWMCQRLISVKRLSHGGAQRATQQKPGIGGDSIQAAHRSFRALQGGRRIQRPFVAHSPLSPDHFFRPIGRLRLLLGAPKVNILHPSSGREAGGPTPPAVSV